MSHRKTCWQPAYKVLSILRKIYLKDLHKPVQFDIICITDVIKSTIKYSIEMILK